MRKNRGLTLIEAMFAILLVATCAGIVAATTPIASLSRTKAEAMNKSSGIAQKQLEAIRGAGYANCTPTQLQTLGLIDSTTPVTTNTYTFTNSDLPNFDNPASVLKNGQGTILVEQAAIDLRRVTVKVTWTERGVTRTVTLGTLIANI